MSLATHQTRAHALLQGTPVESVLQELKHTYKTLESQKWAICEVRRAVLETDTLPPEYDDTTLRSLPQTEEIADFLCTTVKRKYEIQAAHKPGHYAHGTWSEEAERALAALRLLPTAMDNFKLSSEESNQLRRQQEEKLVAKHQSRVITIQDCEKHLQKWAEMLENATPNLSFPALILPLIAVSGRRISELTNGQSTFTPMPGSHYALFSGALKQRGNNATFPIPLLVPYKTFLNGLMALRQKQGADITSLSNRKVADRYCSNAGKALKRGLLPGLPKRVAKDLHPHDLRAIYICMVYECFECPHSLAMTTLRCLAHQGLGTSLCYSCVRIEGADKGSLGPLTI